MWAWGKSRLQQVFESLKHSWWQRRVQMLAYNCLSPNKKNKLMWCLWSSKNQNKLGSLTSLRWIKNWSFCLVVLTLFESRCVCGAWLPYIGFGTAVKGKVEQRLAVFQIVQLLWCVFLPDYAKHYVMCVWWNFWTCDDVWTWLD
jgi:hypothetical protein